MTNPLVTNPLAENCQEYKLDGFGKVTGVSLKAFIAPKSKYKLARASLRDEYEAQGQTVARVTVLDKDMIATQAPVALLWPFSGQPDGFSGRAVKDVHTPMEHMVVNGYGPPNSGPLAIAIVDGGGAIISDVVGGLGLPLGHHVSYEIVFAERGAAVVTPPPPIDEPIPADTVRAALIAIRNGIDDIIAAIS